MKHSSADVRPIGALYAALAIAPLCGLGYLILSGIARLIWEVAR